MRGQKCDIQLFDANGKILSQYFFEEEADE